MHELTEFMRMKPEIEDEYMTWGEYIDSERKEQAEETREEVTKSTTIENIIDLLEDLGDVPESVQETLQKIYDIDELRRLHKIAAKAESIEAFMQELPRK